MKICFVKDEDLAGLSHFASRDLEFVVAGRDVVAEMGGGGPCDGNIDLSRWLFRVRAHDLACSSIARSTILSDRSRPMSPPDKLTGRGAPADKPPGGKISSKSGHRL